jgi:hypothetical protein
VTKHVPEVVSQQFEPPLPGEGQLLAQSLSAVHDDGQADPPPLLEELLLGVGVAPPELE